MGFCETHPLGEEMAKTLTSKTKQGEVITAIEMLHKQNYELREELLQLAVRLEPVMRPPSPAEARVARGIGGVPMADSLYSIGDDLADLSCLVSDISNRLEI